ncbi:MAG: GTP cyclohydrolase I FolE [candidate division Zixibacteria bacterium]|nr:GTP cyclohydrolase I FolE [candidate division Zixibacteria bacterium]
MALSDTIRQMIKEIGEDPTREGLLKTPERVAQSLEFLTRGYHEDPKKVINGAVFTEDNKEMVLLRDVDFYSMCEHHLLPFFGKCHLAYIPNTKIIGLSKLARVVDLYSRRLQVQERLTKQIADTIQDALDPLGVAVVIEAEHLCMQMRGVEKQNSVAVTSALLGVFKNDPCTRGEFLDLIRHPLGKQG